jgi:hypothetical protein
MGFEPIGLGCIIVFNIFGHVVSNVMLTKVEAIGYYLMHLLLQIFWLSKCKYNVWHLILWKLKILIQNFKFCNNICKSKW